ncbi:hypothetical protein [Pseudomonas trivialis]|uniref:Uncharacterized protein n=1 Tax=Pseudomonas trivialis TaxID=200450 RepID=A0A0R2ZDW7_9PSED|nr:hypothetical protein [Pseudomonas trivialis]KRP59062.1 hypothetical protein TU79_16670 [Pseudomonas trivialis]SDS69803.1 hypothetical protein SAMN04490205_3330 [Pseudomonas trivialis]
MRTYSELNSKADAALSELAESGVRWPEGDDWFEPELCSAELEFVKAASPQVIKALIAQNERLLKLLERAVEQHVPLTDLEGVPGWSRVVELVEVVTDRDHLKAELEIQKDYGKDQRWQFDQQSADLKKADIQIDQLKAETEELGRYLCTCRDCGGEGALHTGDWHSYGHMEPPEPVMEKCGECDGTGLIGEIQDLYQVITERDQLRAEVAGLKTGYEAYERVNAELKAENEALRKDAERYRWLRDSECAGRIVRDMGAKVCRHADQRIDAAMGKGEQS